MTWFLSGGVSGLFVDDDSLEGGEPLGPGNSVQIILGDMGGDYFLMLHVRYDQPIDVALREMAVLLGRVANQATERDDLDHLDQK